MSFEELQITFSIIGTCFTALGFVLFRLYRDSDPEDIVLAMISGTGILFMIIGMATAVTVLSMTIVGK